MLSKQLLRSLVLLPAAAHLLTAQSRPVHWSPTKLNSLLFPGQATQFRTTFISNENLGPVKVRFSSAPRGLLSATPSRFEVVKARVEYTITLTVKVSPSIAAGFKYAGSLYLTAQGDDSDEGDDDSGKAGRVFQQPLNLSFDVERVAFRDPTSADIILDGNRAVYPVSQLVLFLKSGQPSAVATTIAQRLGGSIVGFTPTTNGYQLELPTRSQSDLDHAIQVLQIDDHVDSILKNYLVTFAGISTDVGHLSVCDPNGNDPQKARDRAYNIVRAQGTWDLLGTAPIGIFSPETIGIADTGILRAHPEFAGVSIDPPNEQIWSQNDKVGHGTAVAGIIGAGNLSRTVVLGCAGDDGMQMNGILGGVSQFPYKLFAVGTDASLEFTPEVGAIIGRLKAIPFFDVLALTELLGANNVPVANLSFDLRKGLLGLCKKCVADFDGVTAKFQDTFKKFPNTLFVVASGDEGGSVDDYTPANLGSADNVLTVGATDERDQRLNTLANGSSIESSAGAGIGMAAPGTVWVPQVVAPGWAFGIGTSFSAPMVAGAAALLKSLKPGLAPRDLKSNLIESGDTIVTDKPIGGRRLNVCRAVKSTLGLSSTILSSTPANQAQNVGATTPALTVNFSLPLDRSSVVTLQVRSAIGEVVNNAVNISDDLRTVLIVFSSPLKSATAYLLDLQAVRDGCGDPLIGLSRISFSTAGPPPSPDLSITKKADSNSVASGGTLTYTLTAQNVGTGPAASATVTDVLPSNVALQSATSTTGTCTGTTTITCALGSLAANASVVVTIKVTAPTVTSPTMIANSASASAPGDANLANNQTAPVVTTINPPPPTCTLTATPPTINSGQSSTLSWTTTNNPTTGSIAPTPGSVNLASGNISVSPTANTTYTLTVSNVAGPGSCQSKVTVNPIAPQLDWTLQTPLASPSPRTTTAMSLDTLHNQIVLFGGGTSAGYNDETWVWDGFTWTQWSPPNKPSPRSRHAMAYDPVRGEVVLFGGENPSAQGLSDTWVWDGTTWTQRFPATSPPGRIGHTMGYDAARGQIVLFAGADTSNFFSDTWTWNGNNWTQQTPSHHPSPRFEHAMVYDSTQSQIVLFGGHDALNIFADVWIWNGTDWSPAATGPSARYAQVMAFDAARMQTVLFGGATPAGSFLLNDTWTFDGSVWTQQSPIVSPPPRGRNAMVYDVAHGQTVMFGGVSTAGALLGDTWIWAP